MNSCLGTTGVQLYILASTVPCESAFELLCNLVQGGYELLYYYVLCPSTLFNDDINDVWICTVPLLTGCYGNCMQRNKWKKT